MQVSVSEAKGQLTDLVRRAEAGEEIILTRHGHVAARIVPAIRTIDAQTRKAVLDAFMTSRDSATPGPDAAHSQDFLYDKNGMPG